MARLIRITLAKRGVHCIAELLEKEAPRTYDAVWSALPQAGEAQHAKYARNEVYTMVPRFGAGVGTENPTVTPIPGDVGWVPGNVYGSIVEGLDVMAQACHDVWRSGSGAMVEALALLGVQSLALATPYIDAVTDRLVGYLAERGVRTVASNGLGLLGHIWRVSYQEVVDIVAQVDTPEAQALYISCTNLPTYDVIQPLEEALGKPVLTANQVTMWSALRAMGLDCTGPGQRPLEVARRSAA